ncbi:MAG: hypothetical protein KVP17_001951 [Porospora cf. gigantea B]|uniref:uncharacterized protein n=1 Tax=Porospora cf. gigantea B TaxID=2853592 RepID=UPI0035718843|nr:MAG: hypothetical protein KVP17_001951 [Porospora cf. gigantea B]
MSSTALEVTTLAGEEALSESESYDLTNDGSESGSLVSDATLSSDAVTVAMSKSCNPKLVAAVKILLLLAWFAYVIASIVISAQKGIMPTQWPVLFFTAVGVLYFVVHKFKRQTVAVVWSPWGPKVREAVHRFKRPWGFVLFGVVYAAFVILWVSLMLEEWDQCVSLLGIVFFVLTGWIFSKHPRRVRWRSVCWGLTIQTSLALLIIRVPVGYDVMKYLSDHVAYFLNYISGGASLVFGGPNVVSGYSDALYCPTVAEMAKGMSAPDLCFQDGIQLMGLTLLDSNFKFVTPAQTLMSFATIVIPTVIFFSCFMSGLYYLGVVQVIIKGIAFLLKHSMGTSTGESVNAAANIFVGQTEAPLVIKPFLHLMSASEIHAVMTGGFATIAGGVMAAYISFGVSPGHLITASVIAAPSALAMSKLYYPEIGKPSGDDKESLSRALYASKDQYNGLLEAMAAGASDAIPLALNIGAMLIGFMSILEFLNDFINWLAVCVDWQRCDILVEGCTNPKVTLDFILGKILSPVTWMMGVPWKDADKVAALIGMKTIVNEFVAFTGLSDFIQERDQCLEFIKEGGSDECLDDCIGERSIVIATYALCGFANLSSIGIQLGGLSGICPERRSVFAACACRALVAGTVTSLMSASIASFIYEHGRDFK